MFTQQQLLQQQTIKKENQTSNEILIKEALCGNRNEDSP